MALDEYEISVDRIPYTAIHNALISDSRLRLQTRAVLILMLSRPPGWNFSIRGMAKIAGVSKDTMAKMLNELEEVGYVERRVQKREGGRFGKSGWIVHSQPVASAAPCPNSSDAKVSYTKNSPQLNNKQVNNKQDIPPYNPPKGDVGGKKKKARKYALADDAKPILHTYCAGDRELGQAMADMIAQREQLRAINSARAIKGLLADLDRLSGGIRENKLALLRKAIVSSWKSVYPMRDDELPVPLYRAPPPNRQTVVSPHIPMYVRTEVDPVTGKERDVYE